MAHTPEKPDGMAIARQRIAEEAEARTGTLSLSSLGLERLPDSLFDLTHLRDLDLGNLGSWRSGSPGRNHIDAQRAGLRRLVRLERLDVEGSDLTSLDFVSSLPALRTLNCWSTQVSDIAPLAACSNLQSLNCSVTQVSDIAPLAECSNLQNLDCSNTQVSDIAPLAACSNLQSLNCRVNQVSDIAPLAACSNLQSLNCRVTQVSDIAPLAECSNLQSLNCSNTQVSDIAPLAECSNLQNLDCSHTQVSDIAPLAACSNLQSLDCSVTQVSDIAPLAECSNLQSLTCSGTEVSDIAPLAECANLQTLDCGSTEVSDIAPLAACSNLQSLNCSVTEVRDIAPLAKCSNLQSLNCSVTEVRDIAPLAKCSNLLSLYCSVTEVRDIAPLAKCSNLQNLDCSHTQVSDVAPLAKCSNLLSLYCSLTQVSDVAPLAACSHLQNLDCSRTQVSDVAPLAACSNLQTLNASRCLLQPLPAALLSLPSLETLRLFDATVAGIPSSGVLSQDSDDNCLDRVRAHYADLAAGPSETGRVKLILLGNGGVGKTQIVRWLAGKPFEEAWDSTHGIAVGGVTLADDDATQMQIWDFGGQEIYHGAHALFLGGPAVIAIVWDPATEAEPTQTCNGLTFRNQPLAYWAVVARHLGHRDSPLLVIQSKCDRPEQEVRTPPLPAGLLDHRPYVKPLQVSAKAKRGRASLLDTLADAASWLRAPERLGAVRVGAGRLRVQQRLEAMRDADQHRSPDQRQHRLLTMDAFTDLCAEVGGVSSPAALLTYLNAEGTVLHRPGLFDDRIILDQNWALEAVYAVFERNRGAFTEIRRTNGRFTRDLLARLVWQNHSAVEQDLFLKLMLSCGIAFEHRCFTLDDDGDKTIEYIAPELLPATADTGGLWVEGDPTETARFDYPLLHGGLIRSVMAELGGRAGANARYWRDGLCGFEADSQSRLWIDQTTGTDPAPPWQGHLRLRTQGGNARELMDQLVRVVERAQQRVGLTPSDVTRSSPPDPRTEPRALTLVQEKPNQPEWYVSYAWGDDSEDGKAREAIVDRLCNAAAARGRVIVRDKNVLALGDSLIRFMERIGQGDRVFVILSNKYLASPNCMFELTELWRTSKQDPALFRSRVRICALPKTDIWTDDHRNHWIDHWEEQENKLFERIQKSKIAAMADANHRNLKLFHRFSTQVADILSNLTDHIQPRTFEELEQHGLNDC